MTHAAAGVIDFARGNGHLPMADVRKRRGGIDICRGVRDRFGEGELFPGNAGGTDSTHRINPVRGFGE